MKPFCALVFVLFCALALLASPASAEVLYNREGIQLQGTARIVSRNAATCNVLEEKYSPEEYQKMKAMEELVALQQEHGLEPDPEDHFRYARIWSEAGAPERAMEEER